MFTFWLDVQVMPILLALRGLNQGCQGFNVGYIVRPCPKRQNKNIKIQQMRHHTKLKQKQTAAQEWCLVHVPKYTCPKGLEICKEPMWGDGAENVS